MIDYHYDDSRPAQFLIENLALLPKGRALDVAMGTGRNATFLARMGFDVEGVDLSQEAIETALLRAAEAGVNVDARVGDLEGDYRIVEDRYDVIICFNYLQRNLIPQIKSGLRPGGVVVYETFIVDQARFGHPRNPDHLLCHNELLEMFREFRCLRYREGVIEGPRAIASIVAEKVAKGWFGATEQESRGRSASGGGLRVSPRI